MDAGLRFTVSEFCPHLHFQPKSPEVDAQRKAMPDGEAEQQKRLMERELLKGKGPGPANRKLLQFLC
jgi:hypothetical protein